ncbi:MAG: DUF1643 domain-containing protein [Flavicella sp.]
MRTKESNWLYKNSAKNTERYLLGERGTNMVACIGVNPSTAEPHQLDPTLKKVKRIIEFNRFNGWIMYNIYPQRATDPNDLDRVCNFRIHELNIKAIRKSIVELQIKTVWLAYGDLIGKRSFLSSCLNDLYTCLADLNLNWCIVNCPTKKGHPRHPLYQKSENKIIPFDMARYLDEVVLPILSH